MESFYRAPLDAVACLRHAQGHKVSRHPALRRGLSALLLSTGLIRWRPSGTLHCPIPFSTRCWTINVPSILNWWWWRLLLSFSYRMNTICWWPNTNRLFLNVTPATAKTPQNKVWFGCRRGNASRHLHRGFGLSILGCSWSVWLQKHRQASWALAR